MFKHFSSKKKKKAKEKAKEEENLRKQDIQGEFQLQSNVPVISTAIGNQSINSADRNSSVSSAAPKSALKKSKNASSNQNLSVSSASAIPSDKASLASNTKANSSTSFSPSIIKKEAKQAKEKKQKEQHEKNKKIAQQKHSQDLLQAKKALKSKNNDNDPDWINAYHESKIKISATTSQLIGWVFFWMSYLIFRF